MTRRTQAHARTVVPRNVFVSKIVIASVSFTLIALLVNQQTNAPAKLRRSHAS